MKLRLPEDFAEVSKKLHICIFKFKILLHFPQNDNDTYKSSRLIKKLKDPVSQQTSFIPSRHKAFCLLLFLKTTRTLYPVAAAARPVGVRPSVPKLCTEACQHAGSWGPVPRFWVLIPESDEPAFLNKKLADFDEVVQEPHWPFRCCCPTLTCRHWLEAWLWAAPSPL